MLNKEPWSLRSEEGGSERVPRFDPRHIGRPGEYLEGVPENQQPHTTKTRHRSRPVSERTAAGNYQHFPRGRTGPPSPHSYNFYSRFRRMRGWILLNHVPISCEP